MKKRCVGFKRRKRQKCYFKRWPTCQKYKKFNFDYASVLLGSASENVSFSYICISKCVCMLNLRTKKFRMKRKSTQSCFKKTLKDVIHLLRGNWNVINYT